MENKLKIPADRRQTSWLFTSAAEEFELGATENNCSKRLEWELNTAIGKHFNEAHGDIHSKTVSLLKESQFCTIIEKVPRES